jgi:DNA-binding NarL/FixJ family response regulator
MSFLKKIFGYGSENPSKTSTDTSVISTPFSGAKLISLFIVDDNESFLKLVENHLVNKQKAEILKVNYKITTFTNGEECIASLDENPDIILLDYYLNSDHGSFMNGDEVFKKIIEINPQQKVVMLSGQEESSIVLSLIKMGLRDYIMKDDEMFEQLHKVLVEVYNSK